MNILAPFTNNIRLKAMSTELKKARVYLQDTSVDIIYHIIKRCIYTDDQYYNHWEKEITDRLLKWQNIKIKPKNKRMPYSEYEYAIDFWMDTEEELEEHINELIKRKRLQKRYIAPYNINTLYTKIRHLIDALITDVSKGSFIEFNEKNYNIPKHSDLTK